jgi:hypothetical protein
MKYQKGGLATICSIAIIIATLFIMMACSPATPDATQSSPATPQNEPATVETQAVAQVNPSPTPAPATPAAEQGSTSVDNASPTPAPPTATPEGPISAEESEETEEDSFKPYPYTTPLPPPTPTKLDGVYTHAIKLESTPTPCRRCAPYRAEGGTWTLSLEAGVFRIAHDLTGFRSIASFTVSGDQITLFNDPHCYLDTSTYTWSMEGTSLIFQEVNDSCAFGLRAKILTAGAWETNEQGQIGDQCQPPSVEAAVTGHWPAPPGC